MQNRIDGFTANTIQKTNDQSNRVKIVDFISNHKKNKHELILYSPLFTRDPVQLKTKDNKLILIVEERVDHSENNLRQQDNWARLYYHSYARIHNISFLLTDKSFVLVKYVLVPQNFLLKIVLTQVLVN
jgi:hypothetical protein